MLGLAEPERARECLDWIAAHATPDGALPEQSQDHLLAPDMLAPWVEKWGPPPSPLLWAHAMFLTLAHELDRMGQA
jgi:GH15 family glucan-1,4-alpha-glucosidase